MPPNPPPPISDPHSVWIGEEERKGAEPEEVLRLGGGVGGLGRGLNSSGTGSIVGPASRRSPSDCSSFTRSTAACAYHYM